MNRSMPPAHVRVSRPPDAGAGQASAHALARPGPALAPHSPHWESAPSGSSLGLTSTPGRPRVAARDPLFPLIRGPLPRRSVCAAGQPVRPQVSQGSGMSGSDREYPALTGRSGTQRARRPGSHTAVGTSASWSSSPSSDLRTSVSWCVARGFISPPASCSRVAAGGGRWLWIAVRGHLGGRPWSTPRRAGSARGRGHQTARRFRTWLLLVRPLIKSAMRPAGGGPTPWPRTIKQMSFASWLRAATITRGGSWPAGCLTGPGRKRLSR